MAKQQDPFILIYTSKPFPNKSRARKREIQIKSWSREKKSLLQENGSNFLSYKTAEMLVFVCTIFGLTTKISQV